MPSRNMKVVKNNSKKYVCIVYLITFLKDVITVSNKVISAR
jgi:hypothetical protein